MRIVVLIDRYRPVLGGAQNNVHELGRRLTHAGFSITVLTRRIYRALPRAENIEGVRVMRLAHFPLRVASKLLCFLAVLRHLVLRRESYDLVLAVPCVESTDLLPAYFASRLTGKPYVVRLTGAPTFHDDAVPQLGVRIRNRLLPASVWRDVLDRAAAIVDQSPVLHEAVSRHTTAPAVTIPNGVDPARFRPADPAEKRSLRERLGLPIDRVLLVNTGRYDEEKNQIALIRAAERIELERPGRVAVTILGATQRGQVTSNEARLKEHVARCGPSSPVRFVDDATNVEDYLRAADVFVHPTRSEGMSNALVEAMGCGLPIACSDLPEEVCLFPPGHGRFFPPTDLAALVRCLVPLVDSEDLRRSEGAALAAHAREHHANDRLVTRWVELLRGVAGRQTATG